MSKIRVTFDTPGIDLDSKLEFNWVEANLPATELMKYLIFGMPMIAYLRLNVIYIRENWKIELAWSNTCSYVLPYTLL